MRRTHYCGDIRECDIGAQALCMGWVLNKRDMGGVLFIDLKDRQGVLQVVCSRERMSEDDFHTVEQLTLQSVIEARGRIFERGEDTYNPRLPTGTVELRAEGVRLLSAAAPLPYQISDDSVREELRLKYRYLDLRRQEMYRTLKFRSDLVGYAEEFLKARVLFRWKPQCFVSPRPRVRAITSCPAACIRAAITPCLSRRRYISSC